MIRVFVTNVFTRQGLDRCLEAPELDMYTELTRWTGDSFVYECCDLSVAGALIDYLRGTIDDTRVVFAKVAHA